MLFNVDKCIVIHMGKHNKKSEYKLGNKAIVQAKQEKDLGIIVDSSGKFSLQCVAAVKKANSVVGMIRRGFHFKRKYVVHPVPKNRAPNYINNIFCKL